MIPILISAPQPCSRLATFGLLRFSLGAADEGEEDVSPWELQRSVKKGKMETQQKRHPGITKAENSHLFNPLILFAVREVKDCVKKRQVQSVTDVFKKGGFYSKREEKVNSYLCVPIMCFSF